MAYCDAADLFNLVAEAKVREWADPLSNLTAEEEDAVITAGITNGAAEMDGYISMGGNTVPVDPAPDYLRVMNGHLALCALMHRMGVTDDAADQGILERCKKFRDDLGKIADGTLPLPGDEEGASSIKTVELARV